VEGEFPVRGHRVQLAGRFHGPNATKTDQTSLLFFQTDRVKNHCQRLSPTLGVNPQPDGSAQLAGRFHGPNTTKTDLTSLPFFQTDRVKNDF
jgi:hypothetical protein